MKSLNLLPHEAAAAARRELGTVWRPATAPIPRTRVWIDERTGLWMTDIGHNFGNSTALRCPLGPPGTLLYGREAWQRCTGCNPPPGVLYKATCDHLPAHRWKSSATMPREFSRTTLRVVSVVAKRVGEVTEEEARAWGISGQGTSSQPYLEAFYDIWNAKWGKKVVEPGLTWAWGVRVERVGGGE